MSQQRPLWSTATAAVMIIHRNARCCCCCCCWCRFKDFKWYGSTDKVFRLANGSHIELPCNEVTGEALGRLNLLFNQAARQWWDSVVAEPDSFTKPVYHIGQSGSLASNVEANGAIALTRGDINMTSTVVFSGLGYVCYAVNVSCGAAVLTGHGLLACTGVRSF